MALASALADRGIKVEVLYLQHHGAPAVGSASVSIHPIRGRARLSWYQIARHIRESQPDVLLSMAFIMNVPCLNAALLARYRGTVLVGEHTLPTREGLADYPRGVSKPLLRGIYNTLYRRADEIVCVSQSVRLAILGLGLSRSVRRKLKVIPNPVAEELTGAANPTRRPHHEEDGGPVLVCIGRLVLRKRLDLAIDAFSIFFGRQGTGRLLIAGTGPERSHLERQVLSLRLEGRVEFLGYVGDVQSLLSGALGLIHLADSEAFGMAVAESLAMGIPAIVAEGSGGPEELVGSGGIIVAAEPEEVATAMERLWIDEAEWARLRIGAFAAVEPLAPDRVADRWLAVAQARKAG